YSWLETLITEACALEVSLPQTRWLWQLALAADPDCAGALHPKLAFKEEMEIQQRGLGRKWSLGEAVERHGCVRARRHNFVVNGHRNSSASPYHTKSLHGGREKAIAADPSEGHHRLWVARRRSRVELGAGRGRRGRRLINSPLVFSSSHSQHLVCHGRRRRRRRRFPPTSSWIARRLSDSHDVEKEDDEDEEVKVRDFPSATEDDSTESREEEEEVDHQLGPVHEFRNELCRRSFTNSVTSSVFGKSISRFVRKTSFLTHHPPSRASFSDKRHAGHIRYPKDHRLVKLARRDLAAARRNASDAIIDHHSPSTRGHKTILSSIKQSSRVGRREGQRRSTPRKMRANERNGDTEDNGVEEWEEMCGVPNRCKRPRGTVQWIACDNCNVWYHQVCVGIMSTDKVPDVYICVTCEDEAVAKEHPRSSSDQCNPHTENDQDTSHNSISVEGAQASPKSPTAESDDQTMDYRPQQKRPRNVSPQTSEITEQETSMQFCPGESTGANALLQAIAVLEAQPTTQQKEAATEANNNPDPLLVEKPSVDN
uniref:PHD domain-containing protein n=1 Tax=Mesocestoides corti TaxID=53468 RepID=A0A5K3FQS8_MESCO